VATSLDNVKVLLEIDILDVSEDDLLNLYISRSTNYVKNYCNLVDIPPELDEVIEDIAVIRYRNKGVENIKSEGKGSLSESYIDSLPEDIVDQLNQHRVRKVTVT
jgi:hypothetical protein